MWKRFFPPHIDNTYNGGKTALWLFGVALALKLMMGLNCTFNGYDVATRADGIPLETFSAPAVRTVVYLFATWGFSQIVLAVLSVVVLVRYRSMIPFAFALVLMEVVGRKTIAYFLPVPRLGTPPAVFVNPLLIAIMTGGLVLSLMTRPAAVPVARRA
jgi:hypothetical protein